MKLETLIFLYLFPAARLLFFFAHDDFFLLRHLNRFAGRLELFFGWARDYTLMPLSLYWFGNRVTGWIQFADPFSMPYELFFLGLSIYARWWRWHGLAPLQELARLNPKIHPTEFFEHLHARLGFLPHRVPDKARRVIDPAHLDFRTGKRSSLSFWIFLRGVYDTFLFGTLAYKAFCWKGVKYIRTAGSGLSLVWASKIFQGARMEVLVDRFSNIEEGKHGKLIYALNHSSVFDFCLAPLAYHQENKDGSAKNFIPSTMVAKDHFKDNFFLYRVVGLGRMLEAWGMIFVDRKTKGTDKAKKAVSLAVKKLLGSQMTFSIYPQGTRSWGQKDRDGSRWDAAYFCVGRKERLKKEGGYFKKGVAHIAVETALSLLKLRFGGKVWVVPVALRGAGTACPKGSLKVQTETTVSIKVGDPLCIDPNMFHPLKNLSFQDAFDHTDYRQKILECGNAIDNSLQQLLGVKTRLERRFFTDLRGMMGGPAIDEVAVALKEWREGNPLVYIILDCIYALPQKRWYSLTVELAQSLRSDHPQEKLLELRNKVAGYF